MVFDLHCLWGSHYIQTAAESELVMALAVSAHETTLRASELSAYLSSLANIQNSCKPTDKARGRYDFLLSRSTRSQVYDDGNAFLCPRMVARVCDKSLQTVNNTS
ncbi:hypothetical protein ACH5RR_035488 [Cinchona calisaya]|uniref:Uncharacterized protein n=1 Tax=Cinchona calisaya TaxID=153742 RepID=A0ABD2Y3V6_9GENT